MRKYSYEEELVWLFGSTGFVMVVLIIVSFVSMFVVDWKDVREYQDFSLGVILIGTVGWFVANCFSIVLRR
jgi:hypothetical protein